MVDRRSLPALGHGGCFDVAGVVVGVEEVRFVLPDGVGKRGAVDAERERGYMVEGVAGNYARQFWDCRPAAPSPFYLWWPSSRGSLWSGGRSLAVEKAIEPARRLLRPPSTPAARSISAAVGGIFLAARGVSSRLLVDDVVDLLLTAAVSTGVWLRSPCPRAAGLRSLTVGFPLRLDLALVELFGFGIFFEELI